MNKISKKLSNNLTPLPKFRILEFAERIKDPTKKISILGAILWKLNISRATFYRYASLVQSETAPGFDPIDLEKIAKIFNERALPLGRKMKGEDLVTPIKEPA